LAAEEIDEHDYASPDLFGVETNSSQGWFYFWDDGDCWSEDVE